MSDIEEIKSSVQKLDAANATFRDSFDKRLKALDKEVLDIQKKANRFNAGGSSGRDSYDLEESKSAVATFIRSRGTETKGMSSGSDPSGGWTVVPVLQNDISTLVRDNSALRELVDFVEIDSGDAYEELISVTAAGASWVGESSSRPETASPELAKIRTPLLELYAAPVLTQRLADDSGVSMVDFLTSEVGISFAEAEETALFSGNGVIAPLGLDAIPTATTADATRAFGTIQHIPTGTSGAFDGTSPLDAIKTLFYSLKAGYRKNAKFVCSSATALAISKLEDADGKGLWDEGSIQSGQPVTLFGKEVVICESTPAIAADSKSLWFGDWNAAMRGIERPGNKILLDPFTNKPNLVVYIYRRTGFGLRNSAALKCLKFSTT